MEMTKLESFKLLRDTIAKKENAFSIEDISWNDDTKIPKDSHHGKCETPACILGWNRHLNQTEENYNYYFPLPETMTIPSTEDKTTGGHNYCNDVEWFTKERTIAMMDYYIETWDDETSQGQVDWQALEKRT